MFIVYLSSLIMPLLPYNQPFLFEFILFLLPCLIAVAFLTLTERKMLGYSQMSKGPNCVGFYGLLQPIADGLKLFLKCNVMPSHMDFGPMYLAPIISFFIILMEFCVVFDLEGAHVLPYNFAFLFLLAMGSLGVFSTLCAGKGSNCKYAMLGSISASAQYISYEVVMPFFLFPLLIITGTFNFTQISYFQVENNICGLFCLIGMSLWYVCCLAECNRAPFDLVEGESELVSGFNVEYASGGFALFFLAEYAHMILMSYLFCMFFIFLSVGFSLQMFTFFMVMTLVWVRTSLPRMSWDHVMYIMWKNVLPVSISLFMMLIFTL